MGTGEARVRRMCRIEARIGYRKAIGIALCTFVAFLTLALASGCAAGSGRGAGEGPAADEFSVAPADATVQRAMVAYVDGDDVLFVDQETQTPYVPTLPEGALLGVDGQPIDAAQLAAGNVVEVVGNGIMLESYPGQYPGITRIQVLEAGTPADAEQYADIVSMVFSAADADGVPAASVEYRTDLGQVSLALEPFRYEFAAAGPDGAPKALEGDYVAEDGTLLEGTMDAAIDGQTAATVTFTSAPTAVEVVRRPLADADVEGNASSKKAFAKVDLSVEGQKVPRTLDEDGTVAFAMEPGFVYLIDAAFADGNASYAFMALS